jgi:hypothetical protein
MLSPKVATNAAWVDDVAELISAQQSNRYEDNKTTQLYYTTKPQWRQTAVMRTGIILSYSSVLQPHNPFTIKRL